MGVNGQSLVFKDVTVAYRESIVVDRFCLSVEQGELVCFFGPSGCGKSSILKTAIGALTPKTGEVWVGKDYAGLYKSPVSYMPQENELFRWLNVRENVELWHRESAKHTDVRTGLLPDEAINLVELMDAASKMPFELSGGMARRAALARCLATHASIMLSDEAFVSVERRLRRKVMAVARAHLRKNQMTAIFVSHDYEEAAFMADKVVFLTAVPAQISRVVRVQLPQQRDVGLFDTDAFQVAMMALLRN